MARVQSRSTRRNDWGYNRTPILSTHGKPPDTKPSPWASALVDAWSQTIETDKPTALGTPLRNSKAGYCARNVAYEVSGTPKSDPPDLAGYWRMGTGTTFHELWQTALNELYPGQVENEVKVATPGCESSGHVDCAIKTDGHWVRGIELKTVGRYKWERAIGVKGPAEGPDYGHIAQGALNCAGLQAQQPNGPDVVLEIVYLSMESISPGVGASLFGADHDASRRFFGSWTFVRDEWEQIAAAEAARLQEVLVQVRSGQDVARVAADGTALDPFKAKYPCTYCDWVTTCRGDWRAA
jgi:hypothetical protein